MEMVKFSCYYDGYSFKSNMNVELKFFVPSQSLNDVLPVLTFVGVPVKMKAKVDGKAFDVGEFNLYRFSVDNDGECKLIFRSQSGSVNPDGFSNFLVQEAVVTLLLAAAD